MVCSKSNRTANITLHHIDESFGNMKKFRGAILGE